MSGFDPDRLSVGGGNFINGRVIEGLGPEIAVRRPSDGRVYRHLSAATPDQVDDAVENAWVAFRAGGWARRPPRERMRVLRRWADLVEADIDTLAPLEAVGSTRPITEARTWDIPFTAEGIRFFSEFADKVGGEVAATSTDKLGFTLAEPYGVIGAIAPWNFPLVMASWKVVPAIAAGNAVVLKPSEMTPFSIVRLAELAIAAGLPPGIFNIVQGDGRTVGDALSRHPKVAKVTFTGSTRTGAAIMTACAETGPKPVTLELGGKSPQVVFADAADLGRTAATVARAITGNAGQVCVAGSRLIVEARVADQVVDSIAQAFAARRPGPTWRDDTTLSPIISEPQLDRIDSVVKRAAAEGAEVVTGGGRAPAPQEGSFYLPTILANVDAGAEAVRDEIFGPVLTVQTFTDEAEAFALANDSTFGLAAGVHTGDVARALRATRTLEAGTVWVNRYGRSDDFILPTGGYKRSGIGKDLGRQAYEANLRIKTALVEF
ncbi:aldehyde dehydrogenase family protein [Nitrospirillum sp. BR 11163]|uniref:aldehyde dehydrogenase family protein n=1 Tax=Nitrospirillum sp. BR 11163 TaxID=3104323 RepID=UPI002AFFC37E|nr:aldehyde dehydrogenase family protein [Nitrospirillum sp. BR 11163]MEA1671996.1 aldehyde dehydrogenase family protein [Nitrospirillum sp. BR 11163]